ncbi:MAG: sugar transferase [Pseudomonadota bacterium]
MALIEEKHIEYGGFVLPDPVDVGTVDDTKVGLNNRVKLLFDKCVALAAMTLLAPLMLGVALAIRVTTGDSVFFRHRRMGAGGQPFDCLKFRSMVPDAQQRLDQILASDPIAREEWSDCYKFERDCRVTRIGAFLRKTSLDELPQLINVLRGDMSLVGPRPVTEEETKRYGKYYETVKLVRPGLTGLWQVSGRSDTSYEERIAMDVNYVLHARFVTDLHILWKTVWCVLARKGAV